MLYLQPEFKVGVGGRKYSGYRAFTETDLEDYEVRTRLLVEYEKHGGWLLLEERLMVTHSLCVAEGALRIDGAEVNVVGKEVGLVFPVYGGIYEAMNWETKVPWMGLPRLPLDETWSVDEHNISGAPCLFIRV